MKMLALYALVVFIVSVVVDTLLLVFIPSLPGLAAVVIAGVVGGLAAGIGVPLLRR